MTKHEFIFSGFTHFKSSLSFNPYSNTQSLVHATKMCFRNVLILVTMATAPLLTSSTTYHSSTPLLRSNTRSPKLDTMPPDPLPYAPARITQSLNKFSNRLYNVMNEYRGDEEYPGEVEDLVYSPISVYSSLVTVRSGSRFETTQELSTILSLSKVNDSVVEQGLSGVLSTYSDDDSTKLKILNRLFLDHSYHPSSSYHQKVNDKFGGQLVQTEFSNATAASEFVNKHVYEASNGVLQDIISVDPESEGVTESSNGTVETPSLSIDGGLMLISGMTIEGDWARPFTPMLTRKEAFTREDGGVGSVEMMHRDGVYEIAEIEELNATVLSVPYKYHRFSLNVVLPVEGVKVGEVEENLEAFPCVAVMSRLKKAYVQVSLPRFRVETTVDLIDPLEKMGVRRGFSEGGADFGRVVGGDGNPGLYLTNVVHKSVVDVSEGGSRVRGANFVEAVPAQARVLTPFTVNRPFVFFIADRVLNTVVLVGRKVL